ncbi:MAG TPA: FHA domain-containing protein [Polyangiaceae bacterium]|nr:FHA domain-containing protein [Polyangiaceae bacterium]
MLSNTSQDKGTVFAIVISEKGGAERREVFDQPELSIGRVQGNELMLPKGNVSKRHARLVFRDGRYIVTDLNSTNGTYVNRRRINQATIVRQGDRIYIGDFVLRIESQEENSNVASSPGSVAPGTFGEQSSRPGSGAPPMEPGPIGTVPSLSKAPPLPRAGSYPPLPPAPRLPNPAGPEKTPSLIPSSVPRMEPPSVVERPASGRDDSIDTETMAYRSALAALADRVLTRLEASLLDGELNDAIVARVERTINDQLAELRREDVVGASIVDERLKRDVRAELVELGALGPLLEDETVSEVTVFGAASLRAMRSGRRVVVEPPLSSEASVRRVLARLLRTAGTPLESTEHLVTRRLRNGFQLEAVTGPRVPSGTMIHLERAQRVDSTLDDLVRSGAISRVVATFLRHCVAVRANILIVGPREARGTLVAGALASASTDGHVIAIHDNDVIVSNSVPVSHVDVADGPRELADLVDFAGRFPESRLVVDNFSGRTAAAVLGAVAGGADGLLAVSTAASLRRGLLRLPAEIAVARPELSVAAARELLATTFDIVIDVAVLRDGRRRVVRIAEPAGSGSDEITLRDIFSFVVERASSGSVDGTFQATGVAPRILNDMVARGLSVDSGIFSRPPSR